jgi:hypothetical protein
MYASLGKFLLTTLAIAPGSFATSLNVFYSSSSNTQAQQQTTSCAFAKNVKYQLKLSISQESTWLVTGELLKDTQVVCKLSIIPRNVPSNFFSQTFTYVLSQSSTGTGVQRSINAIDESMSVSVSKMGVTCTKESCSSATTARPTTTKNSSSFSIGILASIVAVGGGLFVIVVLTIIIVVAVVVKKRKRRVELYEPSAEEQESEVIETDEQEQIIYDAFQNNKEDTYY